MTQALAQALCWTLVHSLWQGILAAILAGGIVMGTRRYNASVRYTLLTALFFGLVAVFGGTFLRELDRSAGVAETDAFYNLDGTTGNQQVSAHAHSILAETARAYFATRQQVTAVGLFCSAHAVFIVGLWILILGLKLARMGIGLGYIHRIRRHRTTIPSSWWTERVRELGGRIGLCRPVSLLESALIDVPVVIGILKPIILVPLGILSRLPQDQLEAVLLHELAHIRRKDYLVNLLQDLTETLFFFNPALLWISGLIREERENCCDDIAINAAGNKAQLIRALVAFQEFRMEVPVCAVAFPGRKNQLQDRIKRMIYNRNKTLNAMEKLLLTTCLIIGGAVATLAFSPVYQRTSANHQRTGKTLPAISLHAISRDTSAPVRPVAPPPPKVTFSPPTIIYPKHRVAPPPPKVTFSPPTIIDSKHRVAPPPPKVTFSPPTIIYPRPRVAPAPPKVSFPPPTIIPAPPEPKKTDG